jgi:hypothetical protein
MESWEFNPGQNDETWGSNHQILVQWMENGWTAGKLDGNWGSNMLQTWHVVG